MNYSMHKDNVNRIASISVSITNEISNSRAGSRQSFRGGSPPISRNKEHSTSPAFRLDGDLGVLKQDLKIEISGHIENEKPYTDSTDKDHLFADSPLDGKKIYTKLLVDDEKIRPDVARNTKRNMTLDHELLRSMSLSQPKSEFILIDDPYGIQHGKIKSKALRPLRIDKFPSEEAKAVHSAQMSELRKLRKYKTGISPKRKLYLAEENAKQVAAVSPNGVSDEMNGRLNTNSILSSTKNGTESMSSEGQVNTKFLELIPPSPAWETDLILSDELLTPRVENALNIKKKIIVKNIPEERLGFYKRVRPNSSKPVTPANKNARPAILEHNLSTTNNETREDCCDLNQPPSVPDDIFKRDPRPNNPLQRLSLTKDKATRMASRDHLRCCQCSKASVYWCKQCSLSYCDECWSSVPHHGFIDETDLPHIASSAVDNMPEDAFPALKKDRESNKKSSISRVESPPGMRKTRIHESILSLALRDQPFNNGPQMSSDLIPHIDLTLFGGLEGMDGRRQQVPRSARPDVPGAWRKPPQNRTGERGILAPHSKKKRKKNKKIAINVPNLAVVPGVGGNGAVIMGASGSPPHWKFPMANFTKEYFPEEWKDTRDPAEINVYKGVPVHTAIDRPLSAIRTSSGSLM